MRRGTRCSTCLAFQSWVARRMLQTISRPTYLMLRFGDEEALALITGAAYSYNKYVQGSQVTVPLAAFSDAHSAPAQRFYNLLCTAYGSDQARYGDFVEKEYLPKSRAGSCMREY